MKFFIGIPLCIIIVAIIIVIIMQNMKPKDTSSTSSSSSLKNWKKFIPYVIGTVLFVGFVFIAFSMGMWGIEKFNNFVKTPEPFKSIAYEPSKYGPKGMVIQMPDDQPYQVKCEGYISQLFTGGSKINRANIDCANGNRNLSIYPQNVAKMPIQEEKGYGKILANGSYLGYQEFSSQELHVNINVPRNIEEYRDIQGVVWLYFYH